MLKQIVLLTVGCFVFVACGSSARKARRELREKGMYSAGLYCGFVDGEAHTDIDVVLNLELIKNCDDTGSMALTSYRSLSGPVGIMYCCKFNKGKTSLGDGASRGK